MKEERIIRHPDTGDHLNVVPEKWIKNGKKNQDITLHLSIEDIEREQRRTKKVGGLLPRLNYLENLDLMKDSEECLLNTMTNTDIDLPITHLLAITMNHHLNGEGDTHLKNHKEIGKKENMTMKKAVLGMEEEQVTTNTEDN